MNPQSQLAWEATQRPRAAGAALGSAALTLVGALGSSLVFRDAPASRFLDALERTARPGDVGALPSLRIPFYEFYDDRIAGVLAVSVARSLGLLLMGFALLYLAFATRARRPEFPRLALYVPIIGGVLAALATFLFDVASITAIKDFLDGPRTVDAADEVRRGTLVTTAQLIGLPGTLALAMSFVLVCLNAMRAGLLTRFMGVLGMIVGVLIVFPIGGPLPIVQCFWLGALGLLIAGRWPNGTPLAWRTGEAQPWPSQQQIREERQRAAAAKRGEPLPEPEPAGEPLTVGADDSAAPHPASRKKKRKRRT